MVKKSAQDKIDVVRDEMEERAHNFLGAMKNPTMRVGQKRTEHLAHLECERSEFKTDIVIRDVNIDRKDRWSSVESRSTHDEQSSFASIHVQDPRDPDDVVIPPITVEGLPADDVNVMKNPTIRISMDDD